VLLVDISDALREARYEGFESSVVEIDHTYMFSVNTLSALVEKAGFEIVKRDVVDTRHVLRRDIIEPQFKQIRIVARKSLQPVAVTWPDPLREMATLVEAQLARERDLRTHRTKKNGKLDGRERRQRKAKQNKSSDAMSRVPERLGWAGRLLRVWR
jgi:hypothetical protein